MQESEDQYVGQKGKISKLELKKGRATTPWIGYAFKQMKHCIKKMHQKCFFRNGQMHRKNGRGEKRFATQCNAME
jgi:hypothetical protein